jgi:hypothetical protein
MRGPRTFPCQLAFEKSLGAASSPACTRLCREFKVAVEGISTRVVER